MKSIILPGTGNFTLVDNAKITLGDIKTNFFIDVDSVGKNRAKVVCKNLIELNPDVSGNFVLTDPKDIFKTEESLRFLLNFDLVIVSNLSENLFSTNIFLNFVALHRIPIVFVRSIGLLGVCKCFYFDHCIIESKPDPKPNEDLHLYEPFLALLNISKKIISSSNQSDLRNAPYLVVLVSILHTFLHEKHEQLCQTNFKKNKITVGSQKNDIKVFLESVGIFENHDVFFDFANPSQLDRNIFPLNFNEKDEFKTAVKKFYVSNDLTEAEAYPEAMEAAYTAYSKRGLDNIEGILKRSNEILLSDKLTNLKFWVLVKSLKVFLESIYANNKLPLTGSLPDMSSSTVLYKELVNLFKRKHESDFYVYSKIVDKVKLNNKLTVEISSEDINLFVKNAENIRLYPGLSSCDTFNLDEHFVNSLSQLEEKLISSSDSKEIFKYFDEYILRQIILSIDQVALKLPLKLTEVLSTVSSVFEERIKQMIEELKTNEVTRTALGYLLKYPKARGMIVTEVLRLFDDSLNGLQFNSVSSIIGSVGAQEAIKLLTRQFEPLNDTFVYNGYKSTGLEFLEK